MSVLGLLAAQFPRITSSQAFPGPSSIPLCPCSFHSGNDEFKNYYYVGVKCWVKSNRAEFDMNQCNVWEVTPRFRDRISCGRRGIMKHQVTYHAPVGQANCPYMLSISWWHCAQDLLPTQLYFLFCLLPVGGFGIRLLNFLEPQLPICKIRML